MLILITIMRWWYPLKRIKPNLHWLLIRRHLTSMKITAIRKGTVKIRPSNIPKARKVRKFIKKVLIPSKPRIRVIPTRSTPTTPTLFQNPNVKNSNLGQPNRKTSNTARTSPNRIGGKQILRLSRCCSIRCSRRMKTGRTIGKEIRDRVKRGVVPSLVRSRRVINKRGGRGRGPERGEELYSWL